MWRVLCNKAHGDAVLSLEGVVGKKGGSLVIASEYCLFDLLEIIEDASANTFPTGNYEHSLERI